MRCNYCNAETPDDSLFCEQCGLPTLVSKTSRPKAEIPQAVDNLETPSADDTTVEDASKPLPKAPEDATRAALAPSDDDAATTGVTDAERPSENGESLRDDADNAADAACDEKEGADLPLAPEDAGEVTQVERESPIETAMSSKTPQENNRKRAPEIPTINTSKSWITVDPPSLPDEPKLDRSIIVGVAVIAVAVAVLILIGTFRFVLSLIT